MKGRNNLTRKEIRKQKRSETRNPSLSDDKDMPDLVAPREDYSTVTIKWLKEIVKERHLSTKGLSKLNVVPQPQTKQSRNCHMFLI